MIDLAAPTHFERFDPLWYRVNYERKFYFLAPVAYGPACGEFLVGITAILEKVTVMDVGIMSYERSGVQRQCEPQELSTTDCTDYTDFFLECF